jgi:alpha-L-fucosidase
MGTQWNYKPTHDNIKTGSRLIEILIETRAKGGNLLLNVGPHPDGNLPYELETNLREMAAWNFVNQEAIEGVRPWIIPNEGNIWYTASKDKKTVYAILTGDHEWEFGARKEFVLGSVKSTKNTAISVLGQNDKVVEYKKGWDAQSRFEQKADGLHISVVRGQRIYDNYKWPNPITVKLENVEPALDPPVLETLDATTSGGLVTLKGKLIKKGDAEKVQVGFEYRPYAGFAENLYSTSWKTTELTTLTKEGEFSLPLKGLEKGKEYQFRFVVVHPAMKVFGDIKRIVVK